MGDFTFRMGCPLKRPLRVALTDHLRGVSIRARVKPSRVQLAVSKPRRSLLELQLSPQRCDLCRARQAPDLRLVHLN